MSIDVEERLRRGLQSLADNPPSTEAAAEPARALTTTPPRRRLRVAAVALAASVAVTGVAAAAGGVPTPVRNVFRALTGWSAGQGVSAEDAQLVASVSNRMASIEYWSTGSGVPRCEYVKYIREDRRENGSRSCTQTGAETGWDASPLYLTAESIAGTTVIAGHAPPSATEVELTDVAGKRIAIKVETNGYFVAATDVMLGPWSSLEARDDAGALVAQHRF